VLGHGGEAGPAGGDERELGHGEEAVQHDQAGDDAEFEGEHGGPTAGGRPAPRAGRRRKMLPPGRARPSQQDGWS
jgi:hypothetical protein